MIKIDAWSRRKAHPRLRRLGREILHILLTFAVGVAIATVYHELVTTKSIRSGAEKICTVFGRDEQECKDGIDEVLDMSDEEVQNNININWLFWPNNNYGTIKLVKRGE